MRCTCPARWVDAYVLFGLFMSEYFLSVQPPGLMKVRLMRFQKHQEGTRRECISTVHDAVCRPRSVILPCEQLNRTMQGDHLAPAT